MTEPTTATARNGDITLAYERYGPSDGEPLLMIMGLGMQMYYWRDEFLDAFVRAGFSPARFDNRDAGASTHLTRRGAPPLPALLAAPQLVASYRISDMAGDAVAVMDALGWGSAHVFGASLGGMIAQAVAIEHPRRVRSLTSVMSTPSPRIGRPTVRAALALAARPARTADEAAERIVRTMHVIGSPGYPQDDDWLRAYARRAFARAQDATGTRRQLAAVGASPSRVAALGGVRAPTLVVHGAADPLIPVAAGRATAAAVPGARLRTYSGMGHHLPRELWSSVITEVSALVG
ncbi:alpha/beta fold hydrolase [Pseudonocardia sp. GCM10023141]|uniref:alpha/beta fold hydrolase n=1 Tax=Pseudonocardia sp. GCM10023141 TaxID=3252653 RepID=UPI0036075A9E